MRPPVLILQHQANDGPAFLGTWLKRRAIAFELRSGADGDPLPASIERHAALAVLGGAMSANDELPMLRQAEGLIRDAVQRGRPVIGHCLGGQLMARALGGSVARAQKPEIGWHPVQWHPEAVAWFGTARGRSTVFQWHYDAFVPPPGARVLAHSAACPYQAFAIGPHLAMQFHVELDAAKLEDWVSVEDPEYDEALARQVAGVQPRAAIRHRARWRLQAQQRLAAWAYVRWAASAGYSV